MASITERNGRFLVRVRRQGYRLATKTFTRKTDAQAWARRVEADMEAGRWAEVPPLEVPTLKKALGEYREAVAAKMKGAKDYAYRFDEIAAAPFALKPVNEITPAELAGWRDLQAQGRKASTVVRKLALLSGVFGWCVKEKGWLSVNPLSLVRKPRVSDGRDRTLSEEEFDYLMAAAVSSKAHWLAPALTVLLRSAMRRSELFGLKRGAVNFEAATAHLADTKAGVPRDVPLCPQALAALKVLDKAAEARGDSDLIPVTAVGSVSTRFAVTVGRARAQYEADCAAGGVTLDAGFLRDLRLHDCRHHAVSHWAATGGLGLVELMAISGHKNPKMLIRYTHLKSSAIAGKMAQLSL